MQRECVRTAEIVLTAEDGAALKDETPYTGGTEAKHWFSFDGCKLRLRSKHFEQNHCAGL